MNSRRQFIKNIASASVTFCSCCLLDTVQAQTPPTKQPFISHQHPLLGKKHAPDFIDGKKIPVIDTHTHCFFKEAVDLAGNGSVLFPVRSGPQKFSPDDTDQVIQQRIENMDAKGVDMEVLSVNAFWYGKDRALASQIIEVNNRNLAAICAKHPTRFSAFGSITTQFPDLAIDQLETIMKNPSFKGVAVMASVLGTDFSDPQFHPIWAKAEALGAIIFIHPENIPMGNRFKGSGWMPNSIGNPLETTIALQHLIFEGVLDIFPRLKILAAHGGGFLPTYANRMDHACFIFPGGCDPQLTLQKKPSEYLRQIYFDALVFTPEALTQLVSQVGASQVMVGTDSPIPWEEFPIEHIMKTPLSNQDKAAILGLNAMKLMNITAI